jgi:hypothetical protein
MSEKGESRHNDYYGWARRIDLVLRTHYPTLVTRIFELLPNQYVIVFARDQLDAVAIKDEFDNIARKSLQFQTTKSQGAMPECP